MKFEGLISFLAAYSYGLYEVWFCMKEDSQRHLLKSPYWPRGPYHLLTRPLYRSGGDAGLAVMVFWFGSFIFLPPIYGLIGQQLLPKLGRSLMSNLYKKDI